VLVPVVASVVAATVALVGARSNLRRAPAPSSSAPPRPTKMTDLPPPHATSAEALSAYQSALRKLRDGDAQLSAGRDLAHATELEPSFAAAQLRYALVHFASNADEGRQSLALAVEHRDALSERDQVLLGAAQAWIQSQPADASTFARRMREAFARYPLDAELGYYASRAAEESGDPAGEIEFADRALALDPGFGAAYAKKIDGLEYSGDLDGALTTIRDCAERAPNPTWCLLDQNSLDAQAGNCERLGETSRQLLARDPSTADPYYWLANAAYARGQPLETVRELLHQRVDRLRPALQPVIELWNLWALDVLTGDFESAAGRARELEKSASAASNQTLHARAALWAMAVAEESGRTTEAARAAQEFLQRKEAWLAEPRADDWAMSRDPTLRLVLGERRAGLISPADFESTQQRWVDARLGGCGTTYRPFVWLHGYAAVSETPEDARLALAELPKYEPLSRYTPWALGDAYTGTTYFLAGRNEEAIPFLRRAARSCEATQYPFEHTGANLVLGQALAAAGDRDGACAAYGVVLGRWGKARPRSISAEKARALARDLGCRLDRPAGAARVFE
jgi:serine/threonine-protein kinase